MSGDRSAGRSGWWLCWLVAALAMLATIHPLVARAAGPEPPLCFGPACPNLSLSLVAVQLPRGWAGGPLRSEFIVEVTNTGTVLAPGHFTAVEVYDGARLLATISHWTPALGPGQSRIVSLIVLAGFDPTLHCALLIADARAQVAEDDENNVLSIGHCLGG